MEIQGEMSERAIELLELPEDEPQLLLDLGCGSGLSGTALDDEGHIWVGLDISSAMLSEFIHDSVIIRLKYISYSYLNQITHFKCTDVARERDVSGDLILGDMGQGLPFRPGSFDGAISISALQWLCNADKTCHKPVQRLYRFFTTLYGVLVSLTYFAWVQ